MPTLFKRQFKPSAAKPAVAVLDAQAPPGLAFTRSLGRAGIPVHVFSPQRFPVARLSRYCERFGHCPDPEHAEIFLPWLQKEVQKGNISYVAPTSDLIAFYMGEFPECFPPGQAAAMPSKASILNMLFKDRFDATCKLHGIRAPWTAFPLSVDEALQTASSLPYPVILKPKSHVGVGWARGVVVRNEKEMRAAFCSYPVRPETKMLMDRFAELAWPMVQEYVPDALKHLYSISGVLSPTGEIIAWAGSRKTLQWPPTLGVGITFESWNEKRPVELGLNFVKAAVGRGIFELELIYDGRTHDYVAIDLNPRAHGHIAFDLARGNDLPLLWYQMATGEKVRRQPDARDDVRWLHTIPYHVGGIIGLLRGPERLARLERYREGMTGQTVDIIHDWSDVMPSLAHAAYMFRHPGGLIKPFMRDNG